MFDDEEPPPLLDAGVEELHQVPMLHGEDGDFLTTTVLDLSLLFPSSSPFLPTSWSSFSSKSASVKMARGRPAGNGRLGVGKWAVGSGESSEQERDGGSADRCTGKRPLDSHSPARTGERAFLFFTP